MRLIKLLAQGIEISPTDIGVPRTSLGENNVSSILKIVFGVAGAIALLIVVIGGFRYVISQGNPQETAKAKNTILYALIGLVVCLSAYAIVAFVVTNI